MRLAGIALAWLGYFALHSLLADSRIKDRLIRRWPRSGPAYRLLFNAIATISLLPVLWLVYTTPGPWLWQWRGPSAWVANGLAVLAVLCFLASTRAYDMDEFLGMRQWRERGEGDAAPFTLSALHRYVRHPWYCIGLVLIWTRNMNGPLLVSALAMTLYFVVGSRLEDRKLVARYGETYRRYAARVPGLIPRPWKRLSAAEACELLREPDR